MPTTTDTPAAAGAHSVIPHVVGGDRCADAFGEQLAYDEDAVEAGDAHADLVAHAHGLGGFRLLVADAHMPGPARGGRGGAGLVDAHSPEPRIDADGRLAHPSILPCRTLRCGEREIRPR